MFSTVCPKQAFVLKIPPYLPLPKGGVGILGSHPLASTMGLKCFSEFELLHWFL
jgi:hypothetical protein